MRRYLQLNSDHLVFVLLVVIAVVGRMGRVDWNFTPVAATALFAGYYFRNRWVAALVPLSALAVSDLVEQSHSSRWVLLTVWASMLLPAMLGPWLRASVSKSQTLVRSGVAAMLPALFFFLTTNFAVWAVGPVPGSARQFTQDLAGLGDCYLVAIPFALKMLTGDLFYITLIFGAWAAVTAHQRQTASSAA